jgi:hypothetical protein
MYLLMQIISAWPHVRLILPSAAELNKGPDHASERCRYLLKCQYVSAFNAKAGISTMTYLDPELYDDQDWIDAQVKRDARI